MFRKGNFWRSAIQKRHFKKVSNCVPDLKPAQDCGKEQVELLLGQRLSQAPPLPQAECQHLWVGCEGLAVCREVPKHDDAFLVFFKKKLLFFIGTFQGQTCQSWESIVDPSWPPQVAYDVCALRDEVLSPVLLVHDDPVCDRPLPAGGGGDHGQPEDLVQHRLRVRSALPTFFLGGGMRSFSYGWIRHKVVNTVCTAYLLIFLIYVQ